MLLLKDFFEKDDFEKKIKQQQQTIKTKPTNCKVKPQITYLWEMCNFVSGTMSSAKPLLLWSVIHYQVTF